MDHFEIVFGFPKCACVSRALGQFVVLVLLFILGAAVAGRAKAQHQPLAPHPSLALNQHVHDSWQVEDGLPQNTVNAMVQTSDGYLWLATQGGIARFDGIRFTTFAQDTSRALSSSIVHALLSDSDGPLWIGMHGGIAQYTRGRFVAPIFADSLSGTFVRTLHEDTDGRIWIGTQGDGLHLVTRDGRVRRYTARDGLSGNVILALADGAGSALWIGTEAGLTRLQAGQLTSFGDRHGLPGRQVKALARGADQRLWVGTDHGVAVLRSGQTKFSSLPLPEELCGRDVSALYEDTHEALWIGTLDGGVCRYADGAFDAFTTADGLTHNRVRSIFQDREGSLWIGTELGGLNRLRRAKFAPISVEQGLPINMVFAVMEARDGTLWTGTDGGGLSRRASDGTFTTFTRTDGLSTNEIAALAEGDDGTVWVGTLGGGLCRYVGGRIDCAPAGGRMAGESVYALWEDHRRRLWIGTDEGIARLDPDGTLARFTTADGLSSNLVSSIIEGRDSTLWVGTMGGGLNRFSDASFTAYGEAQGLAADQILALDEDRAGTLWVGTFGGGLCRVHPGEPPACFSQKDGLGDNVLQVQEDEAGHLWLGMLDGILRVRKSDLEAYAAGQRDDLPRESYGVDDGLPARELNGGTQPASWRGHDGTLYFATIGGIATIDPTQIARNTVPPPVSIEQLRTKRGIVDPDGDASEMLLSARNRDVEFHYTGLSFAVPEHVTFHYRLVGYDEEWVAAETRRDAYYTNLPPGGYRFEVRARNHDGVWSTEPATLAFRVAPFFYETLWFYALGLLVLGLLAAGGYGWRMRHVRARERKLEQVVAERTSDLRAREHELKEVNAKLASLNAGLEHEVQFQVEQKMAERLRYENELIAAKEKAEESARIKSTILQNMSHEIRTPISSILGFTQILGEEVSSDHKEFIGYIEQNGKRLLDTLNSILDLSRIEGNGMKLDLEEFDVAEQVAGTAGVLAPSARQSGLTLRTECPDGPIPVRLDKATIDRVVYNLVGNAIKFTDSGEVIVRVDSPRHDTARIMVRDSGIGISEDFLPELFHAFTQESDGLNRSHEGTGLGLTITKRLVEALGGTIDVESTRGEGTCFWVRLPRNGPTPPSMPPPPDELQSRAPSGDRGSPRRAPQASASISTNGGAATESAG